MKRRSFVKSLGLGLPAVAFPLGKAMAQTAKRYRPVKITKVSSTAYTMPIPASGYSSNIRVRNWNGDGSCGRRLIALATSWSTLSSKSNPMRASSATERRLRTSASLAPPWRRTKARSTSISGRSSSDGTPSIAKRSCASSTTGEIPAPARPSTWPSMTSWARSSACRFTI